MRPNIKKTIFISEMVMYTLVQIDLNGHAFPYRSSQVTVASKNLFKSISLWKKNKKGMQNEVLFFVDILRLSLPLRGYFSWKNNDSK
jgi:hypothetical protein